MHSNVYKPGIIERDFGGATRRLAGGDTYMHVCIEI